MEIDLNIIKNKILEKTLEERNKLQEIYNKSCKKATKIAWVKRILFLTSLVAYVFVLRIMWHHNEATAVIIFVITWLCSAPFIGMFLSEDTESFYESSLDSILRKNKDYCRLKEHILSKKDQLVKEDMSSYLAYLKDKIGIYVLGNNYLSFVESFGNQRTEVDEKIKKIIQEIESSFSKSKFLLFKDLNSSSDVYFHFSFSYKGKSLLGTEAWTTVSLNDTDIENGTISYKSWENCW